MQGSAEPLGLLVAAIRRAVKTMVTRRIGSLGLAPLQFWVLVGILEAPGASQAELARRLRCDEPSVSRVVATLVRRGWLRASRHQGDRRRVLLALTPSGRALARRLVPIAVEVRSEVEAPLPSAEREQVRKALARIAGHLQQRSGETTAIPTDPWRAGSRRAGGSR